MTYADNSTDGRVNCPAPSVNKIVFLRKKCGMTQRQLADAAGMNIRQIQKLESGETLIKNTSIKNGLALASALGVKVLDLI